jgi:uncharacterized protein with NAD-binding domain and iron-sulfur cluster
MAARQKVAILGGGMGSVVAAFELTSTPELRARYDVTVYQFGWRLGGKCASGRNAEHGQRIEEHGLHVWFGFYENAFRVMRDAYEELGRDPSDPLHDWRDAFKPCDSILLYEEFAKHWRGWSFDVPRNPLTPGDQLDLPEFWEIAHTMLDYLLGRWGALKATNPHAAQATAPLPPRLPFGVDRLAAELLGWVFGRIHPERAMADALRLAERLTAEGTDTPQHRSFLWKAIDEFKAWMWKHVVRPHLGDDDLRFFFTMMDAGTTILQGIVEDDLIERGFDEANGEDLREWLRRHGAQPITVDQGPFVRALYDMAFAYVDGDIQRPSMAAGTALNDILRLFFTYRGAFAWKMQAGMGDTVFTPFYDVLERRGVKFELFHWVSKLGLSADRHLVETIEVIPQVHLKDGSYAPFVQVNGLRCWPSQPLWDQIVDGDRLRAEGVNLEWEKNPLDHAPRVLRRGEDFDIAVCGISVAALREICQELIEDSGNPRFRAMVENAHTTMTQAFQLWLNRPNQRLGWPFHDNSVMTAYVEPLDTYANMSHLIPREGWPPDAQVEDIAYFCGVLKEDPRDTQERTNERVHENAVKYLQSDALGIWPDSAAADGSFEWRLLADAKNRSGPDRFDSQYWLANFQATERYVLTPAGSVEHRLRTDESGYENLFLAGDWTKTGLDAGCVEAAVMSGMQASRAISGSPALIVGEDERWLSGRSGGPADGGPAEPSRYVDYGGLATCPSPVDCDDATLYSFFVEADHTRLVALCDKVFREPSAGEFELLPLGHHVMLSFGIVKRIKPRLEPWCRMGFATERQVAFWIPVVALRRPHGVPVAARLGWFVPYMWVDNPLSLAGGREIYGYNKNWGRIELPKDGSADGFKLDAYGGEYGGGRPAGYHRLIEVVRSSDGSLRRGDPAWEDLHGLTDGLRRILRERRSELIAHPDLELADDAFEHIVRSGGPPQFFLKQFRSVSDSERASGQQITDGGVTLKRIKGRPLLTNFRFTLHDLDSHPAAKELGVRSQDTDLAFEVDMDFVLEDGRVLWEAPSG